MSGQAPAVRAVEEAEAPLPSGASPLSVIVRAIAGGFAIFHLYTGFFGLLPGLNQRIVHLAFALVLVFLAGAAGRSRPIPRAIDLLLAACALATAVYAFLEAESAMGERAGIVLPADIVAGVTMLLLLLEATRRVIGLPLPIICGAFLAYSFFGRQMPGLLGHRGYDIDRLIQQLFLSDEGFFGLPLGISANYLLLFMVFGAVLKATSAGQFFMDIAFGLFGRARGGPAKMAVVGSALFGTISGSAVANTVSVGTFTVPLMKRVGLKPVTAAAIEAVASTGGQIMPPVMGAAAFLVAEILGIPYIGIAAAATIPAAFYFASLFLMVDFEAGRLRISGLPASELPDVRRTLRANWHLLVSPALLLYLLGVAQTSPLFAVTWSVVAALAVGMLRSGTRPTPRQVVEALQEGAMGGVTVAIACACSGIVIGVFTMTGLGFKASSVLIELAHGQLFVLLLLSMAAAVILGTGLPTVPSYLLLAVLVAPALIQMGVEPIAAHLFIFYFGAMSDMTPPLALSAFAAASIAGCDPMRTGVVATRMGFVAYIIPFFFVYKPELLLVGDWSDTVLTTFACSIGLVGFTAALQGFLMRSLGPWERMALFAGSVLIAFPGVVPPAVGLIIIVGITAFLRNSVRRQTGPSLQVGR